MISRLSSWIKGSPTKEIVKEDSPTQEGQKEAETSKANKYFRSSVVEVEDKDQPKAEEQMRPKKSQSNRNVMPSAGVTEKKDLANTEEPMQASTSKAKKDSWSSFAEVENKGQSKAEEPKQAKNTQSVKGKRPNVSDVEKRNQLKADSEKQVQSSCPSKTLLTSNFVEPDKGYQPKTEGEKQAKIIERTKMETPGFADCQKEAQLKLAEQNHASNRQPRENLRPSNVVDCKTVDQPKAKTQKETKSCWSHESPRTRSQPPQEEQVQVKTSKASIDLKPKVVDVKKDQPKAKEQKSTTKVLSCIEEVEKAESELRQGRKTNSFKNMQYNRIRKSKPTAEFKILILGSTGVGKSTFINGFANYLKYTTLSEALKSKIEYPIPSIFNVCNEKYEDIEITMGEWKGPAPKFGESVTQECYGYDFDTPLGKVTLIDAPGTDDTKGLEQDKINCEKIIEYLRNYEHLSAICIMLQANCSRENAAFEFCLKQLFSRLPKSFATNICFVFTHAQTATVPWEIGSTGSAIENFKKKVRDMSGVVIPFGQNCFSVDNEGLRMVAQYQSGQRNFKQRKSVYIESWTRSEAQCAKLVEYVSRLTPQPVKDIIFLNKALNVINVLNETATEVNIKTQELNRAASVFSNTLYGLYFCEQYLEQRRFAIATEHIVRPFEFYRFVCQAENCPTAEALGRLPKLAKESCHSDCKLDCSSANGQCNSCGCYWDKHEHVDYELIEPGDQVEDAAVSAQMTAYFAAIECLNRDLISYKKKLDEMQVSGKTVEAAAIAFAKFMKETPIAVNQEGVSEPIVVSLLQNPDCPKKVTMSDLEATLEALFALPSEIGMKLKTNIGNLLMVKDAAP